MPFFSLNTQFIINSVLVVHLLNIPLEFTFMSRYKYGKKLTYNTSLWGAELLKEILS